MVHQVQPAAKSLKIARQFVQFGMVGSLGVLINWSITYCLTEFAGMYYMFSLAVGTLCALCSNFILNLKYTFKQ